jgi:uncharacterized Zn-binding protein involved in type VI secretion
LCEQEQIFEGSMETTMNLFESDGSFDVPNKSSVFDPLPDGRLVVTDGTTVWLETDVGSRAFTHTANFLDSTLAGFMRISPSGRRAVLISSDGKQVVIFDPLRVVAERTFDTGDSLSFDSEWVDDDVLAVTLAEKGQGTLLKFFNANDGTQKTILRNLGDASGGVTFDPVSRLLYAGIGYLSTSDPKIGLIKAFRESEWSNPPNGGIDFDATGSSVANFLSASFLGFDKFGNLYVGGGDAFGGTDDLNYVAVIRKRAVDNSLLGGSVTDPTSSTEDWESFDPDLKVNDSWFVNANRITGSMYLKSPDSSVVNVFRPTVLGSGIGVLWRGQFHLGDNAFYYSEATYVGLTVEFPIAFTRVTTGSPTATLTVQAREVQTVVFDKTGVINVGHSVEVKGRDEQGDWVTIGEGYLKTDGLPITVCSIAIDLSSLGTSPCVLLCVRLNTSRRPGSFDDIILTEVSADSDSMVAKLGFAVNPVRK